LQCLSSRLSGVVALGRTALVEVGKGGKAMTTLELEERVTIVENQVNGLQATVQQFITSMSDLILRMEKENEKRHTENETAQGE
jgi:hypothetical protein